MTRSCTFWWEQKGTVLLQRSPLPQVGGSVGTEHVLWSVRGKLQTPGVCDTQGPVHCGFWGVFTEMQEVGSAAWAGARTGTQSFAVIRRGRQRLQSHPECISECLKQTKPNVFFPPVTSPSTIHHQAKPFHPLSISQILLVLWVPR